MSQTSFTDEERKEIRDALLKAAKDVVEALAPRFEVVIKADFEAEPCWLVIDVKPYKER